jgi:tetratricopeptide (TPR) repeat protein
MTKGYDERAAARPRPAPGRRPARRPTGQGPPPRKTAPRRPPQRPAPLPPEPAPGLGEGMETDPAAMPEPENTVIESGFAPQFDQPVPAEEVPAAVLRVKSGADMGRVFALPLGEGVIGRGADCDVVLADIAVSRRHCAFNFDGKNVSLTDQGSGNGTKINAVRVRVQTLNHGDIIGLGKTELQFEIGGQPVQASAPAPSPGVVAAAPVAQAAVPVHTPVPAPAMQAAVSAPAMQAAAVAPVDPGAGLAVNAQVSADPAIPQAVLNSNQTAQVLPLAPPNMEVSADLPAMDAGGDLPDVNVKVKVSGGGFGAIYAKLTDTKPKKLIFFGVVGLFGFVLLLGIITSFMGPSGPKKRKNKTAENAPQGPTPEQVFNQASAHIKAKRWPQALALLKKLQAHDPTSKVYNDNATFVENNIKANAVLEKARQAIRAGKLVRAELRINEDFLQEKSFVEKGTCKIELPTCKAARRLARRVRYMKAAPLVAEARELAKSKKRKMRSRAMEKILAALKIAPDAYQAQKIRHELGGAPPTAKPDPDLDRIMADKDDPAAIADPSGGSGVVAGSYGGMPPSAKTLYQAQDFAGAVRELNRVATKRPGMAGKKLQKLAGTMSSLASSLKSGDAKISSDQAGAIAQYRSALAYDSGFGGTHQVLIKGKLFRVARVRASTLLAQGNYAACYAAVNLAASYGSVGLDRLREQLGSHAKRILEEGYVARGTNLGRAKTLWRQVQRMVPASNKWHKKAAFYLKLYGGGGGGGVVTAPMRRYVSPMRRYVPRRRYVAPRRRYTPPRRRGMRPSPRRRPRRRYFVGGGDEDEDE